MLSNEIGISGLRAWLGEDAVTKVISDQAFSFETLAPLPRLNFAVLNHEPFRTFSRLPVRIVNMEHGILYLECDSKDDLMTIRLGLDFCRNRVVFDQFEDIYFADDVSPLAAEQLSDVWKFKCQLLQRGAFLIINARNRAPMAYCAPAVPQDFDIPGNLRTWQAAAEDAEREYLWRLAAG